MKAGRGSIHTDQIRPNMEYTAKYGLFLKCAKTIQNSIRCLITKDSKLDTLSEILIFPPDSSICTTSSLLLNHSLGFNLFE